MSTGEPQRCGGLRVLVVEKDDATRQNLDLRLRHQGHEVRVATSGPEAIRAAEERWADLVLVNLALPGLDGPDLAVRLRQQSGTAKRPMLVALTGHGGHEVSPHTEAAGMDFYLTPPAGATEAAELLGLLQ